MPRQIYNPKDKYYNDNWKRAFIKDYQKVIKPSFWDHLFFGGKGTEEFYGKDMSEFNLSQIISLLQGYRSASENALRIKVSLLRTYTQFCINNKLIEDVINHYDEIDTDIILSCIDKKKSQGRFITPNQLSRCLTAVENSRDKFLIIAVYEGICGKQLGSLLTLQTKDFRLENDSWIVQINGVEKNVSDKLKEIAFEADEAEVYYKASGSKLEFNLDSPYIIKNLRVVNSIELNERALFRLLDNLHKRYSKYPITYTALRFSGFMNRFDQLVKQKGDFLTVIGSYAYQDLLKWYELSNTNLKTKQLYDDYLEVLEEESSII